MTPVPQQTRHNINLTREGSTNLGFGVLTEGGLHASIVSNTLRTFKYII